jgi:hypothetical protein
MDRFHSEESLDACKVCIIDSIPPWMHVDIRIIFLWDIWVMARQSMVQEHVIVALI